jgi:hypothetical protein
MNIKPIPITNFKKRETRNMEIDEIRTLCNRIITREIPVSLTHEIGGPTMFAEEVESFLRKGGKVKVYPTGNGGETINVDRYEIHRGEVAYEF